MSDSLRTCSGVSAAELSTVLDLISGTDISELDITSGKTRLSLRRPAIVAAASSTAATAPAVEPRSLAITSPLVGIFHAAVATGDILQPGQSIGAVEALGMPTTVEAPQPGTVEELLVHDGSPVEYGQPLLILRRVAHAPASDG
jgi:acetyl-CoA carboxylase biotin carboxyl carrier protein